MTDEEKRVYQLITEQYNEAAGCDEELYLHDGLSDLISNVIDDYACEPEEWSDMVHDRTLEIIISLRDKGLLLMDEDEYIRVLSPQDIVKERLN